MKIYFPMTANVLTVGHIKCIDKLTKKGKLIVGLLTAKALEGYKKERAPFRDRAFILKRIVGKKGVVVAQNSLNPEANLKKFKCDAMASGDGWEQSEIDGAKKLGVKLLNIKSGEKIHSKDI